MAKHVHQVYYVCIAEDVICTVPVVGLRHFCHCGTAFSLTLARSTLQL